MLERRTPPMSSQPCRRRHRDALAASVYHSTPLFRGLLAALDEGLNRHTPCPCPTCTNTHTKRSTLTHPDAPAPKRARRTSPSRPTRATTPSNVIHYCHWCSFPDHSSRLSCRECGRRRAPPAMAQHFLVERTPLVTRPVDRLTSDKSSNPPVYTNPVSSISQPSTEEPCTPVSEETTDPSTSCHFSYSPQYSSAPLPEVQVSPPMQQYLQHIHSAHLETHSLQSTVLDATEITDYESLCTPESRSTASKSLARVDKHEYSIVNGGTSHYTEDDIDVDSLMQNVSKEVIQSQPDIHRVQDVESARFSLVSSAISDITSESAVEFSAVEDEPSKHIEDHRVIAEHSVADLFLSEIIMSDDEKEPDTCNDIPDLPLLFLDGILPPLNEQDAC